MTWKIHYTEYLLIKNEVHSEGVYVLDKLHYQLMSIYFLCIYGSRFIVYMGWWDMFKRSLIYRMVAAFWPSNLWSNMKRAALASKKYHINNKLKK